MPLQSVWAAEVDTKWYAPSKNQVNDLDAVPTATGVYGFIFNSSKTPDSDYGVYNWCNMPHVRRTEYVKPSADYELKYVELASVLRSYSFSLPILLTLTDSSSSQAHAVLLQRVPGGVVPVEL